ATPEGAANAKLSDEQRIKIASLIQERSQALAKAGDADKPKIIADFDAKAQALLAKTHADAPAAKEPKLRFNFRFQRWLDVLDWVARQCDLSLVLDAPPQGTFDYTDAREYSPTEALDLLNGVLQPKAFTHIRRGRMLIGLDLKAGIPDEMVPQIEMAELE